MSFLGDLFGAKSTKVPQIPIDTIVPQQRNLIRESQQDNFDYNRPKQFNRFGNVTGWYQNGTDASGNPTFAQYESLGNQGQRYAGGFENLGKQYFNQVGNTGSMDAFNRAQRFYDDTQGQRQETQRDALVNRLRNQGFSAGDEGYKSATQDQADQFARDRNAFTQQAQGQFFDQGERKLQDYAPGLQYGSMVLGSNAPSFNTINTPAVDLTGLYGLQNNRNIAQAQSNASSNSGLFGGLSNIGSAIINALPFSDARLKEDIKEVGELKGKEGSLPIYSYRYKGDPDGVTHIGVMAQEAEQVAPSAVPKDEAGLRHVDYKELTKVLAG